MGAEGRHALTNGMEALRAAQIGRCAALFAAKQ
jgi:hypothetical protein